MIKPMRSRRLVLFFLVRCEYFLFCVSWFLIFLLFIIVIYFLSLFLVQRLFTYLDAHLSGQFQPEENSKEN